MRNYIIAACVGIFVSVSLSYFFENNTTVSTVIASIPLIVVKIYEYYNNQNEKEKEKKLEEQKQRFSKFREGLSTLESRLKPLSTLFNTSAISQLAKELTTKLLELFNDDTVYIGIVELLKPKNKSRLETVINTVLEENETAKKLKEYNNEITNILETNIFLLPHLQILLYTLFDLLIFYSLNKVSKTKIVNIFYDNDIKSEILSALTEYSKISINIQLSAILAKHIRRIPAIDYNARNVKITEDMLEDITELIDQLLYSYNRFNDGELQAIYDNLHRICIPSTSYTFIETCDTYLPLVVNDLDSEIKEHLFELYKRIKEMLERNKHAINFPQGF